MKRSLCILVTTLLMGGAALPFAFPVAAQTSFRSGDSVLTGELVVTDPASNRFRLVGHGNGFTAPPGVPIEELDGKPVRVEIGPNGRVLQITQEHVPLLPLAHSYEVVKGELVVADAAQGAFTIAGDHHLYTAPPGTDLRRYAGQMVQLDIGDNGRVQDIQLVSNALNNPVALGCSFDGQGYSEGATKCQAGMQYSCQHGSWENLGLACSELSGLSCNVNGMQYASGTTQCVQGVRFACDAGHWHNLGTACAADGTAARLPSTCSVGGATVANGSSICRAGTTFRCDDGAWISVGTACR